ncbi:MULTISPECIES: 1-deoxy-D-xylulose-5-phosphate reductoisomerase [unclassified Pseudoalteromonas]|jgi:1-deoxy-D-xylulose-5-phosphate reductoisomerase|uniref:1-deoxy-D-xylulose 5-phosphate reductoisomerase n=1 Tax=Pseudoalteromonas tetraodonis TaxID=43659 RepID=A0ABD4EN73_9GAMM|nr:MULTISPECIES: 1-deoxy-D-xylulose-5-phosphate reductoisomerase [Pseudoalteromonas]ADT69010.1 1-deoxy-D-xylulose 5-phosphate reductoisomerase [Pseudoalteromonas sp. SM9913]KYL35829.1 1-deoxy-D-xylulose-5-phosphate reductoisomerase [Pseudoalteromonas spiralis]MDN3395336.1 1-deoxy-D-xylulose-5-phosphate reductoisomerase [Pseudoalteromonas sp. APC 3215]MDN3470434.1 1-deoxy-D-xylulose-5-phosphate reductoisomerase [Pseudoalteromonas sp. APC 4026]
MSAVQQLVILGATGSIGLSTLDVVARNQQQFKVFALTAGQNAKKMAELCIAHQPRYAVMASESAAKQLSALLKHESKTQVMHGEKAMSELCAHGDVDTVMSAIVGAAGLLPTLSAVEAGKKVLLANKESLVMSGQLFIDKVKKHQATLLPIDSEHNAIFQCLPSALQNTQWQARLEQHGVSKILLTGSGGPFLNRDINTLNTVSVSEAVAHPNWSMGQKISVDSATMMNKGLEFIEAKWLFNCDASDIDVVIHPQSIIHSMVQYQDGSILAQMGNPDMRTPIAHALAYPERIDAGVKPLNFSDICDFSFTKPDFSRYPNLKLAIAACDAGQGATTTVNAANEIAVNAFLQGQIRFTDIYKVNAQTLDAAQLTDAKTLDEILECDRLARISAAQFITKVVH